MLETIILHNDGRHVNWEVPEVPWRPPSQKLCGCPLWLGQSPCSPSVEVEAGPRRQRTSVLCGLADLPPDPCHVVVHTHSSLSSGNPGRTGSSRAGQAGPAHILQGRGGGRGERSSLAGTGAPPGRRCTRGPADVDAWCSRAVAAQSRKDNLHHTDHMVGIQVNFSHNWLAGTLVVGVVSRPVAFPCTLLTDLTEETPEGQKVREVLRRSEPGRGRRLGGTSH